MRLTCLVSCDLKRTVSSARPRICRKHESPGNDQRMDQSSLFNLIAKATSLQNDASSINEVPRKL